jgi:hypothetical protein
MACIQFRSETDEEGGLSYLVHCILHKRAARAAGLIFVESGRLAAALSLRGCATGAPEATQLVAYERKISALHAAGPVIPMRYGYVVEDEAAAVRLLEERGAEYEELLERLKDRVEMGLRVLWDAPSGGLKQPSEVPLASVAAAPGAAWLAAARSRHSPPADLTQAERTWAAGIDADLADLYAEERREARPAGAGRMVSLYFLVPRRAVRRFRARLCRIVSPQGRDFLVSGPWAPWNFVMAVSPEGRLAG